MGQLHSNGMLHLDIKDPADLQRLLTSGMIWSTVVPAAGKQYAIDQMVQGTITPTPEQIAKFPPGLLDHINEERNQIGQAPLGGDTEPSGGAEEPEPAPFAGPTPDAGSEGPALGLSPEGVGGMAQAPAPAVGPANAQGPAVGPNGGAPNAGA